MSFSEFVNFFRCWCALITRRLAELLDSDVLERNILNNFLFSNERYTLELGDRIIAAVMLIYVALSVVGDSTPSRIFG